MDNIWKCSCGQDNDGRFCINCGAMKPDVPADTVGAPAPVAAAPAPEVPAAAAPAEAAAPAAPEVPAAAAPVEAAAPAPEVPAAVAPVEAAAPAAPEVPAAAAPVEAAAPAAPEAPAAAAPVEPAAVAVAPVAAAAAVAAVTPDAEPVQVIKCQPMPETPVEDFAAVPADPEFAVAEPVPVQPAYQPQPVQYEQPQAAAIEPAKQVGPVSYQNTASNPYSEPDRASHNPYAPAPVAAQPYNAGYGYAAAPAGNSGIGLLILGIVAVVLAFDVTLGAIICGAIGCSMAKKLKGPDGQYPTGKAKVGAILSKVGLIIGIVTTIIAIIWFIIVIVGIIAGAGYAASH